MKHKEAASINITFLVSFADLLNENGKADGCIQMGYNLLIQNPKVMYFTFTFTTPENGNLR